MYLIILHTHTDNSIVLSSPRDSVDAGSPVRVFPGTHDKLGSYAARFVSRNQKSSFLVVECQDYCSWFFLVNCSLWGFTPLLVIFYQVSFYS